MSSSRVSTSSLCGLSLIQSHSFLYVSYLNRFALHKKHVEGILVTFEAKKTPVSTIHSDYIYHVDTRKPHHSNFSNKLKRDTGQVFLSDML